MRELYKYNLDSKTALIYFQENLNEVNTLSKVILKVLDLKSGKFFTLLPDNANFARINAFSLGGILPSGEITEKVILGKRVKVEIINNIREGVAKFIFNNLISRQSNSCIFDDIKRDSTDPNNTELFRSEGVCYDNEVYYIIDRDKNQSKVILDCLNESGGSLWHSLCVLSKADCGVEIANKKLTHQKIKEICKNAKLVLIGAYDNEGYLFWEPQE